MAVNNQTSFTVQLGANSATFDAAIQKVMSGLTNVEQAVKEKTSSIYEKVTAIGVAWEVVGKKLADLAIGPLKAAAENERVVTQLQTTLAATGKYSAMAMEGIVAFADELEQLSGFQDEVIKKTIAQNVAMGMSVDQAKLATKAAAGLAAVSGTDLVTANEAFLGAMEGNTKGIKKWVEGVDSLTTAQLRAGAAYDMSLGKLSKFIGADSASTLGALDRLKLAFSDTMREAGQAFLTGFNLGGQRSTLNEAIDGLGQLIRENKPAIQEFGKVIGTDLVIAIKEFGEALRTVGPILTELTPQLGNLIKYYLLPFADAFVTINSVIAHFSGNTKLEAALDQLHEKIESAHTKARDTLNGMDDIKPVDWDHSFNTSGLQKTVDQQASIMENYKTRLEVGFAGMAMEQAKATAADKAAIGEWGAIWDKLTSVFRNKVVEVAPPHPELFEGFRGPPTSAMAVGPDRSLMMGSGVSGQPTGSYGTLNRGLDRQQIEQQTQMRQQLKEARMQIEMNERNEVVAEYTVRMAKISDLERQAADRGVTISREANALKVALAADMQRKLADQYAKDRVAAATAAGDQVAAAKAAYAEHARSYADLIQKNRMTDAEARVALANDNSKIALAANDEATKYAELAGDDVALVTLKYEKQRLEIQRIIDLQNAAKPSKDFVGPPIPSQPLPEVPNMPSTALQDVKEATSSMAIGTAMPMMAAVDKFADAVQAFLDFFPNLINKIAKIFDTLRDLPLKLADAILNLFHSIASLFAHFVENLTTMVTRLLDGIDEFIEKLPAAINKFIQDIPKFFTKILDKLPSFAERLVKAIMDAIPALFGAIPMMMRNGVPAVIHAIIKDIPAIVRAFRDGLINGLKDWADIMGGKFKPPDLGGPIQKAFDSLKGSASQIFSVEDFKAAAKGVDLAGRVKDAFNSSSQDWLRALIAGLKQFDPVLKAIFRLIDWFENKFAPIVGAAWHGLIDWFENKLGAAFSKAWHELVDWFTDKFGAIVATAWHGIIDWFTDKFGAVVGQVWHAVTDWFENVFGSVIGKAWHAVSDWFENVFGSIISKAWSGVSNWFDDMFGGIITKAFDGIMMFKWPSLPDMGAAGNDIAAGLVSAMNGVQQFFKDIGSKIWEGLWKSITDNIAAIQNIFKTGGGSGGLISSIGNTISSIGKSQGGIADYIVDYAASGPRYAADGDYVSFRPQNTDVVPYMVAKGEGILSTGAVANVGGAAGVKALNNGAKGIGGGNVTVQAPITINTQSIDDNFIRNRLGPAVMEMMRKASIQGNFVLDQAGVRTLR